MTGPLTLTQPLVTTVTTNEPTDYSKQSDYFGLNQNENQISILIVGNGIIGLTTAIELRRKLQNCQARTITNINLIITSAEQYNWRDPRSDPIVKQSTQSTNTVTTNSSSELESQGQQQSDFATNPAFLPAASPIAGGWWYPYQCKPPEKCQIWSVKTLIRYYQEYKCHLNKAQIQQYQQTKNRQIETNLIEAVTSVLIEDKDDEPDWLQRLQFLATQRQNSTESKTEFELLQFMNFTNRIENVDQLRKVLKQDVFFEQLQDSDFNHLPDFQGRLAQVFRSFVVDTLPYLRKLEECLEQNNVNQESLFDSESDAELDLKSHNHNVNVTVTVSFQYNIRFLSRQEVENYAKEKCSNCSIIINCAGCAGGIIAGEDSISTSNTDTWHVQPARGILAVRQRPQQQQSQQYSPHSSLKISWFNDIDSSIAYVIPRSSLVVCGGCYELPGQSASDNYQSLGSYKTTKQEEEQLLRNWNKIGIPKKEYQVTQVKSQVDQQQSKSEDSEVICHLVGWRPTRKFAPNDSANGDGVDAGHGGVRCEIEDLSLTSTESETEIKLFCHNYGHGGAGWTLAWGCAEEMADMILEKLLQYNYF